MGREKLAKVSVKFGTLGAKVVSLVSREEEGGGGVVPVV